MVQQVSNTVRIIYVLYNERLWNEEEIRSAHYKKTNSFIEDVSLF